MRFWWAWGLFGAVGCAEDPLSEAWNATYEVDRMRRGPGCESPEDEAEPFQPYVGLGYGADPLIDLEVLTMFWCEDPASCINLPQANAWLDVATETRASGEYGEAELVAANVCQVYYSAITADQTPDGKLTLSVILTTPDPIGVKTLDECTSWLEDVVSNQCTERFYIEGTRTTY